MSSSCGLAFFNNWRWQYLEHHLGFELAVIGHVVGVGRAQRRIEVAKSRQVVAKLRRRRHRQEDLAAPSVRTDLTMKYDTFSYQL